MNTQMLEPQTETLAPNDRKHWNTPQKEWTQWPQYKINQLQTLEEFIAFFEEIPADKWCRYFLIERDTGRRCARGHLGTTFGPNSLADNLLVRLAPDLIIHNNNSPHGPKEGTLTYLRSLLK